MKVPSSDFAAIVDKITFQSGGNKSMGDSSIFKTRAARNMTVLISCDFCCTIYVRIAPAKEWLTRVISLN